ncbi:Kinase interacting (KIP1-like) family protein [Rhynchospora pubera]|uniref:Kinase interacting (KIP1-like) family protein n=1 Tax=Rhynchospora pubera TaxID=906938 RepID=A0AAV8CKX1_9POAL|nr:Kinase interacting (KIP1-like) family protein [Rhynchospora pubera]KAJ4791228.1 Kinase interacting (KIP1-like) family protein [Rhynchospora pubera]
MVQKEIPQAWWFDSHNNNSRQSPWLLSTLLALEEKTKQMLKLIENDADSFAQRAEMYYKKRPLLVGMIEEFYRDHRSLAEQCDLLKSSSGIPSLKSLGGSSVSSLASTTSVSSAYSSESDSEVDDPEPDSILETESEPDNSLETELKRLREENEALKVELEVKDEEKREVIRQLSYAIDLLKKENRSLRKNVNEPAKREGKGGGFDVMRWTKEIVSGKIFTARCKSQTTVVAL